MPPCTVVATSSARASEGRVKDKLPFTDDNCIGELPNRSSCAWREPLMVESSTRPPNSLATNEPLMHEASTSPATPLMSNPPLISSILSSRAPRGTEMVYSTLAGLSSLFQFQLLSCSGYLVRIDTRLLLASTTI